MNSSHDRAHPLLGVGLVLVAASVFAVNGSVSKIVLGAGLTSLQLVEIRCTLAALVFAAVAAVRDPGSLRMTWRELGFIAIYGVVGVAMVQWLYFVALSRMPVSVSLLIEFTAPLMIALWVRFVRKQPVRSRVWVALALIIGGLAMVAQVWSGLTLDAIGLLAASLAAVCLAIYYVLGERAIGRRDAWSLAAWSFGAAALFWSIVQPWWLFPFDHYSRSLAVGTTGLHAPVWLLVTWVVLLGTVTPFALLLTGLGHIGATRVGLVGTAEPPLAGVVAWLVLGETLSVAQIIGAVIVLSGIVLAETARSPQPAVAPAPVG